jgi:hypothetical protein
MVRTNSETNAVRRSLASIRQYRKKANGVGLSYGRVMREMRPWRVVWREQTPEGKVRRFPGDALPPGRYEYRSVRTYIDAFCRLVHVVEGV